MPRVGFQLTIPEFQRAKTVHALDRAAIAIGDLFFLLFFFFDAFSSIRYVVRKKIFSTSAPNFVDD
jgi:hypothetical protein